MAYKSDEEKLAYLFHKWLTVSNPVTKGGYRVRAMTLYFEMYPFYGGCYE